MGFGSHNEHASVLRPVHPPLSPFDFLDLALPLPPVSDRE